MDVFVSLCLARGSAGTCLGRWEPREAEGRAGAAAAQEGEPRHVWCRCASARAGAAMRWRFWTARTARSPLDKVAKVLCDGSGLSEDVHRQSRRYCRRTIMNCRKAKQPSRFTAQLQPPSFRRRYVANGPT